MSLSAKHRSTIYAAISDAVMTARIALCKTESSSDAADRIVANITEDAWQTILIELEPTTKPKRRTGARKC